MRDILIMRTTLDIDDDVLEAAKEIAKIHQESLGKIVSKLIRNAVESSGDQPRIRRNGVLLFPHSANAKPVTPEMIAELNDETK